MAEDVLVTYKVGESIYQIPASNQEKLLEKYPDAERMSTFNYGGEDYYIPNQNAEKFISKYPDAEPMDNDANIFMQSYRGKQNRGIPTITVTEGEENGLTSTLAESEDVSQKPKASNGDIATPQPVNDTFFKEDAATQQQNIAKDKKDRAIAEQIYNTFESKPELFKTVEAREKFYDLLASKGYANAFSIGESMVSGDSRFDQRDEKESYIPNAGIDYVIGRRRHDDIVNTPVMRDPAVQLKLHTTFTNAGEGLQQTINTLNAGGDNEQQRSMAKDFSLLQTRLSSIQKAEKEGRINTQGAKDAIKNLSDAAANIRKKYKNYIDGVTEEGEQKKTFEEKITGESIEGKKDFAGISLDTKPTPQKVKGLSKDAREKVLSTLDDIESLYKKFSSVSAQSNAAYVNRPENQYQLATALSEMGKFKESNKILGELLNKNAASYQIYQAAAYNYYQLGDNAAARSMQIAAQQRQPISDIPSNEGGDTTGLDMGLGNPANPQYGNQGSPTPASEEMGLIAGALRHYTPLYSNAANISEGWMHALEKLKKGGIDYSKLQQAKNFGDVVKLGVGEGARTALNTIAGFAEGLFAYSMNTTPVGLAFVEGTQGLTAEGAKATIGKVGAETFNYFRGLKGSDKVTPDEAVAAIMMPVTTVLQGKEMRGAEIPEWAKDVGLIADVIAMHLFMGAVSRLRGTEEAKTAQDILDGKEVTVEHANNLIYSIIKMTNEEGGVIYKIQHEYAEKLKELEKTVADFPETREVLQPEIEATNKKLEDIQGTLLHHDILTESSRVEIQGKEKALSALKDAIEKQKEGSAAKPLLEERARQLQEEIDGLEAERVQKTKDAVDAHARESFAKLADEVLDIRFGDYVDYGGIKGRVERRPDGVVVVTPDGKEVLVEGGFSGKRLKDLGLKKIEEPKGGEPKGGEPKTEPQPETEVEQGVAEVKAPDVKFNFEENTVTVDGKKYTYDGVGVDKDGNTTSIRVIDENGNVRHLRNEEVVFEIELQKETAELGMIEKSEVEAAAKELNIKEQKNEKETRGTPEKQQGVVEKLQPAEQAKAVEENKGEQKQEQLKTQDDAVQEQKTKGVDVRQQAADGEAVGERNAKGQEITDKGEAEKIKKQIAEENAKSEWQKEQEAIDNDSSLSEEEKEKKKIESTAKALSEISKTEIDKNRSIKNAEKIDGTGSHIKNMSLSELNELARDMVKNEKEYQDKLSDAQGVYNLVVEKIDEISEAYHKAKADGSNPELVKAVEELLGKPTEKPKTETTPTVSSEVVSGSALKDVVRQESDAEKLNKEAGVDIYVARQDIDTNGGKYTLSQIKENGNTNTFLIEDAKGNEVGKAQLSANGNYLENIRIDEKHRRKGLASKVYDFIELRKGIELEPSPNKQSKEAKALWDKRNLQKSVSNKANGGLLAKALGESMSKTFADFRNKQQVLLELENKYFEQKGLSKEEFNKLSENEKSEIIKDAIKWKNDNPELVKAVEELLGKKEEVKSEQKAEKPTEQKPTIEQQVKTFGVAEKLVKPVVEVANALFSGLKKAGLVAKESVEDWLNIGKADKVDENSLDGFIDAVKKELPKVEKKESKIQSWIDKWNELKKQNDLKELDLFYNKVKVALNGYAQGKGVEAEFKELKKDIEDYAEKLKQEQEPKVSTTTEFDTKKQPINKLEDLQDVGEKIGGAKKDLAQKLSEVTTDDLATKPLSKVFPKPDFKRLVEEGSLSEEGAILLNYLYDNIPTKPRRQYRVANWVKTVDGALQTTRQVLEAESTKNLDFTKKILDAVTLSETLKKEYKLYSDTMKGLGFPKNDVKLGGYEIKKFENRRRYNNETEQYETVGDVYSIVNGGSIIGDFKTMDEAVNGLKAILEKSAEKTKGTKFDIYQDRKTKEYFIGKKGAVNVVRVVEGFKTLGEARTFLKEKQPDLQSLWDAMKAPKERRMANRPRVGVDWRKGKNIDSKEFAETFGFRGVEFGNWVNNAERQSHVNEAYDALMDLASVLGVSPKALSLNGELGFAFGARGSGRANAHYESGKVVINLTKTRGAGSLAHEWWHALDNYFSRNRGQKESFITENPIDRINRDGSRVEGVRKEMIDAFRAVMDAIKGTKLAERSKVLDRTRSELYWSTPVEMSARSFENYIIEKLGERNQQNDYLANFKEVEEWIKDSKGAIDATKNYPYPLADETHSINEAYQNFFDTIQEREEGGRSILFQQEKQQEVKLPNGQTGRVVIADVVDGFYSNTENALSQIKQEKGTGNWWKGQLLSKGAKADEMKWTTLDTFLEENKDKSVTKEQIAQYLKDNRVQIVEVVKGEDLPNYYLDKEPPSELGATRVDLLGDLSRAGNLDNPRFRDYLNNKYGRKGNKIYDWLVENSKVQGKYSKDTKFSEYQLEGDKENYKEVLVTMPVAKSKQEYVVEQDYRTPDTFYAVNQKTGVKLKFGSYELAKSQAERLSKESQPDFDKQFKSSHFDEPNILVHLRMNTRTDANGNKVLFLEEVQSDWGQQGKKEGFKSADKDAELKRLQEEASMATFDFNQIEEELDRQYEEKKKDGESRSELRKRDSDFNKLAQQYIPAEQRMVEARRAFDLFQVENRSEIPTAPFVTDTNAWTKLGLKVALKEAVTQGADKISWTTGEQQNERYDLSKQVDEIGWQKNENGTYNITPKKDGSVIGTREMMANLTIKQIEDYVGKEVAEKIQNEEGKVWDGGSVKQGKLTGQQLKVGGKGMIGFYGNPSEGKLGIVGQVAKSLFKQEPKTIDVFQSDKLASGWSVTTKDINGNVQTNMFDSKSKGLAWLSKQEELEVLSEDAEGKNYTTQHSIEITPELKAAAEKGMPLFQNANAQYRIKAGEHIVEALKDFDGSPKAVTAIVHEFMHPTVVEIFNGAKEGNETGVRHANTIVEEYNKANPSKKVTLNQMIDGNDSFINGRTTPEYRAVQEFIAEAWEKYHHEGAKGFSKAFQEALDAITEAFRQVYKSLTGVTLTPELRKMFDELLGMEEVKQEQKQEKPAIEKTLVEEHGVAKEDAAIVTSVLDKLNKGLQSMGVSFDITKGLQLGKGKEGSEASAHAQFRIDKGKRIVEILKSDLPAKEKATAVLHEVGHLSLHELLQQHIDGSTPEIKKALDTMIKAFNESGRSGEAKKRLGGDVTIEKLIEEHNAFKEQGEKINAASTEALSDNIPNFRDFHEFITDSLNKYLKDGTAGFGKEFDAVLQKIKELLVHVYDTVRGGTLEGLTVSPELKQVFDRMLGKDVDLFKEPEKPQAKPLGEVKVDMPTTDEQGRVMSLSEALRMAKEQGQIKGKETGGLKHSEGMSEADFVAMYQKQQQDNLRAELLGAEDVDVAHTAGEERISQRQRKWKAVTVKEAKKIIEGLDPKYESTNAESVNSLVDRIFAPFQDYIKAGVDVFDVASEYAKSIYPKDRTEPYAAQKAAVATVLMTKAANELRMGFRFADSAAAGSERGVFKRGTLEYDIAAESLKKFEDYLSGDKRVDATALAFANSHINPNEVYALLDAIDNSRKKVMGEKAKSGRTKEEVAKEMRTLKPTAEEVDTAAEKATAKTTKVKPKRSLFSGSTTKKTRSTISVERKKSAKDKLKSGLSKIQAAIPSAKPTPKKGGLTEEPPLPKGVVEGVKDIAEAAISEGHYTQEAIKDYVAEKTKGILDRATSDGIIDKAWDGEIKQKSGAARADEVSYAIVKALKTGKGDAITKQLGEALLMQDAEYDPSSKTKRQQATARLAEILKDPAAAEARLNAAINMVVNQSIVNPKMLDYLGLDPVDFLASKENPHGMTMEQFEAFSRDMLKKKLYDMAQDFMGHGVHEQRVLPLPKKRIKPSASEVKKFIKDFYDNPEMTDSMLETALTDHFDITPEQATAIASKVRGELADIVASRSQKKIDALAEEISDGDRTKKKRVTDMVVKALTTNGAFGDIPFSEKMAAALSNRSVAPADINKILAYGRMANATDSSLLKAFYMRKAATILSKYDMSAASFLFQGLYEQGVVNILGNPRTSILTASLSMLKTMPFDVARMFVTRPSTFVRAVRFSKLIGSKGIGSVTGEGFRAILNGVETVRNRAEIETKPQIRRESANKQARLTSWRYLRKASLSGNDPKRAQLFILKALQSLTFSGGSLRQNIGGKTYEFSPTHWLVNLISGLDVVVKAGLMNLHNYYNAERFIRESGIKFGTSEFTKKMSEMLTTDPLIFDAIDKQVNMEVADAMKNGIPLPKDYVHERKTQLYQEYVDKDVVSQSLFEINKSALIGIPRTWLGAHTYNFIRSNTEIKDNEKTVNAAVKYIFGSALYFSRVGINVIERRGRGIPFYNMFLAAAPYEFTIDASGKVVRRTTESGKVIRRVENKRDFAFGILQATTTTALAVMLINNIFQQEDLKDEKGNPVIDPATGEPVKHWVLNPSSPIRFHGRKKALTTTEKNAVPAMCIELTNVEDPDKRFWKFEWFPESWYPMLFMLGEESDDIRYKEEKLQVGGTEKDNSMLRSVQEEPTSMFRIVTTAGIGAFNASFTTPAQTADEASRLISQDKKRDAAATIAYRLTGQPFITTVNPRLAGQIADAYDYFKEREKTYVKLSIENTNIRSAVSNMAQYSMNQVWAGRYLVNNEDNKYTIYDAHGQPMEREPGDLLFLPAMFSEDMYYGWAEHIYKSPLYKIYMDDNGNFDESVIAIPNRIGWNDKVSVSDMVKQQVRQKTREYYGQLVTKFYGKLLSTPYEERGEFIKELWKAAVNEAKTEYGAKEKTVEGAVGVMQRKNMTDGNAKEE